MSENTPVSYTELTQGVFSAELRATEGEEATVAQSPMGVRRRYLDYPFFPVTTSFSSPVARFRTKPRMTISDGTHG